MHESMLPLLESMLPLLASVLPLLASISCLLGEKVIMLASTYVLVSMKFKSSGTVAFQLYHSSNVADAINQKMLKNRNFWLILTKLTN